MWGSAVIIHVDRSQNALKGAIGENLEIGLTKAREAFNNRDFRRFVSGRDVIKLSVDLIIR